MKVKRKWEIEEVQKGEMGCEWIMKEKKKEKERDDEDDDEERESGEKLGERVVI